MHNLVIKRLLLALVAGALLSACADNQGAAEIGNPASPESLLASGATHLSNGEFKKARAAYNELITYPTYECQANYGLVLAGVQDTADRLDTIADAVALGFGGAPGSWNTMASIDVIPAVRSLLVPFESYFTDVLTGLQFVVDSGCKVTIPGGIPIEIGNPNSLVYLMFRLGYEFDASAARVGQVVYGSALAAIHMILAHDIVLDSIQLSQTIQTIVEAARGAAEVQVNGPGDVTSHTLLSAIRSLGALPDNNAKLLSLGDLKSFKLVDNDLLTVARAIYDNSSGTEQGILPQLAKDAATDNDPTDNFLGLDDVNHNGKVDKGDRILIGLRELHVTGLFSMPDITGGVSINLNAGWGDVDTLISAGQAIVQVLGDQMASVDDKTVQSRPLGLAEINKMINAFLLTDFYLKPLPDAVAFDFGAYFKKPVGIRDIFPYWVDDDNNAGTPAVFLIEGESWVTAETEPYVTFGDTAHFSGSYRFDPGTGTVQNLSNLGIAADGIEPSKLTLLSVFPLPYVAWRDPTFNGVLSVDLAKLPYAPETASPGLKAATNYSANKASAAYFNFVLNEWLYSQ